ncbi:hypothetical protein NPIL_683431 [Nephila pilipes]|uniref:Uncharacterized protein n=1 Tax=Nephila pilipes TaxID=299642 RepID=A0A8X6NF93_NEPPI|nr:hypothetical protein NPIL_683431 [Nephila pilipes]
MGDWMYASSPDVHQMRSKNFVGWFCKRLGKRKFRVEESPAANFKRISKKENTTDNGKQRERTSSTIPFALKWLLGKSKGQKEEEEGERGKNTYNRLMRTSVRNNDEKPEVT